ncbi:hypothetical protein CIPAW_05G110700 [Carya illinoinensis]|uniref:Uncharacterized protein n=1 Tax=Carya illinoinensis TaxID=32201 RepID=A0A8T1QIE1_CARIL|nr:hypothetical protein CIPAW_05G110700 [Carya illinoinensis]
MQSSLPQWSVIGTVKYIDSKHYLVPKGRAAVEIISGGPSGILTTVGANSGDANDSCFGNFMSWANAGMIIQNLTMTSQGNGSAYNHSYDIQDRLKSNSYQLVW